MVDPNEACPSIHSLASSARRRIETLTARLDNLSADPEMVIARALTASTTWAEIAQSIGVTPQAAYKRYRWLRYSERTGEVCHERPLPT